MAELAHVRTLALDIGYEHSGPTDGPVVVLLHGYPFDVRAFDSVAPILNAAGLSCGPIRHGLANRQR